MTNKQSITKNNQLQLIQLMQQIQTLQMQQI
jgi:hypothetical protein